jgi:hypothetical protein
MFHGTILEEIRQYFFILSGPNELLRQVGAGRRYKTNSLPISGISLSLILTAKKNRIKFIIFIPSGHTGTQLHRQMGVARCHKTASICRGEMRPHCVRRIVQNTKMIRKENIKSNTYNLFNFCAFTIYLLGSGKLKKSGFGFRIFNPIPCVRIHRILF